MIDPQELDDKADAAGEQEDALRRAADEERTAEDAGDRADTSGV